jgi:hypothetical protein
MAGWLHCTVLIAHVVGKLDTVFGCDVHQQGAGGVMFAHAHLGPCMPCAVCKHHEVCHQLGAVTDAVPAIQNGRQCLCRTKGHRACKAYSAGNVHTRALTREMLTGTENIVDDDARKYAIAMMVRAAAHGHTTLATALLAAIRRSALHVDEQQQAAWRKDVALIQRARMGDMLLVVSDCGYRATSYILCGTHTAYGPFKDTWEEHDGEKGTYETGTRWEFKGQRDGSVQARCGYSSAVVVQQAPGDGPDTPRRLIADVTAVHTFHADDIARLSVSTGVAACSHLWDSHDWYVMHPPELKWKSLKVPAQPVSTASKMDEQLIADEMCAWLGASTPTDKSSLHVFMKCVAGNTEGETKSG